MTKDIPGLDVFGLMNDMATQARSAAAIKISWSEKFAGYKLVVARLRMDGEEVELVSVVGDREFLIMRDKRVLVRTKLVAATWLDRVFTVAPLACFTESGRKIGTIEDEYNFTLGTSKFRISRSNYFGGEWYSGPAKFLCSSEDLVVLPQVPGNEMFFCALGIFLWVRILENA